MRRLLVFGTGAAVIGIVLLIVAFYEAYLIVSTLQADVGQNINTNLVLEDATLEAVFLGVMAALGYGLVSKGLDGIRRQELLEMEGPAQEYGRERVEMREDMPRNAGRPMSGAAARTRQVESVNLHPGIKGPVLKSTAPADTAAPKAEPPIVARNVNAPSSQSSPEVSVLPVSPSTEGKVSVPSPSMPAVAQATQGPTPESSATPQSVSDLSSSSPNLSNMEEPIKGEVVWEGEGVQGGENVEALPEPQSQGVAAVTEPASVQGSESGTPGQGQPSVQPGEQPKRRRGRPKGSKSTKKVDEESSTSAPAAPAA